MKRSTSIFCLFMFLTVLFFVGNSNAFAQALDGTWFEINVNAKGYVIEPDETVKKGKLKTKVYMYVEWNGPQNEYIHHDFSEDTKDNWVESGSTNFRLNTSNEDYIFLGRHLILVDTPDGAHLELRVTGYFKVKLDKTGRLKKATFKSLGAVFGAEAFGGENTLDGLNEFYGGCTLNGKLIDESKLPFVP